MFLNPLKNIEDFNLEPGMKVADFGSGSGFYSIEAAKRVGDKGRVYAIDVQKELLHRIKKEAEEKNLFNLEIVWADLDEMNGSKLSDNSMDAAITSNVLFQISEKEIFVSEIKRVLKPGGKVLVIDWMDSFSGLGPDANNIFPKARAEELFVKNGFQKVKELTSSEHHYILIFKKI